MAPADWQTAFDLGFQVCRQDKFRTIHKFLEVITISGSGDHYC